MVASTIIQAGKYRHRVTLQIRLPQNPKDTFGQPDDVWTMFAEDIPAEVRYLTGKELFAAQQVQADATVQIAIRWRPGIGPHNGPLFRVLQTVPDSGSPEEQLIFNVEACLPDLTGRKELVLLSKIRSNEGFRADG